MQIEGAGCGGGGGWSWISKKEAKQGDEMFGPPIVRDIQYMIGGSTERAIN